VPIAYSGKVHAAHSVRGEKIVKYLQAILVAIALLLVFAFPAWAQSSGACQNPQVVRTVGPATENTKTPFTTTGNVFRVSYEVAFKDPEALNHAGIDIETPSGGLVKYANLSEDETNSYIVTEGAGSYNLVVKIGPPNGATYTVTIEDCVGSETTTPPPETTTPPPETTAPPPETSSTPSPIPTPSPTPTGSPSPGGPGGPSPGPVDNPDKVIPDTTSKKPLPDTGGVPLLGLAVGALALVGVGFSVLRTSIRRGP
jgi:hypothetical protein